MELPSIRGVEFRIIESSRGLYAVGTNGDVIVGRPSRVSQTSCRYWGRPKLSRRAGRDYVTIDGRGVAVDRLILKTFAKSRPGPGMTPRHINGDKSDNRLVNLRWGYRSERSRRFNENATGNAVKKIPIPDMDGYYAGSDGFIWTCWTNGGCRKDTRRKRRVTVRMYGGELNSVLPLGGTKQLVPIAPIIANAFGIARPTSDPAASRIACIGYIDGNRRNTSPANLTWRTA